MRMSLRRLLRVVLGTTMLIFVMLNLHVLYNTPAATASSEKRIVLSLSGHNGQDKHVQHSVHAVQTTQKLSVLIAPKGNNGSVNGNNSASVRQKVTRIVKATPKVVHKRWLYHKNINVNNTEAIKEEVSRINSEQHVHNLDRYGLSLGTSSLVIVIQTHDRPEYLKILLDSLRKVQDIQHSLLIVSHDIYSHKLNEIVETVDFCPVMQIFFPHSQQIFAHEFPGEHPNDCPRNVKKAEAIRLNCNNANHPDKYGHYREAKYCQPKHHWIWKLGHVFEGINLLKDYDGEVMLLEDDYYLSEDIIFSTQMLKGLRDRDCPECRMLVLGNYDKNQNYAINGAKVERAFWISSKHNMGMTFNRSVWQDIKKCSNEFCSFDDYNWDWTLQHLSMKCIPNKVRLLVMKASRIFHIGECGMHKKSKNCDPKAKVKQAEIKLAENKKHLYPNMVTVAGDSRIKLRDPKPNGGWGDNRDHNLCRTFFNITAVR